MIPDPLPHQPDTESLESSTALPALTAASLDNVGAQAARMVDETMRGKGRRARKAVEARTLVDDETVSEPASEAGAVAPREDRATAAGMDDLRDGMADAARQGLDGAADGFRAMDSLAGATGDLMVEAARRGFDAAARVTETLEAGAQEGAAAFAGGMTAHRGSVRTADTLAEFNTVMAEALRANLGSAVTFWTALLDTRSVAEAAALNRQLVYKQVEAMTEQNRALLSLAQKMMFEAWSGVLPGRHGVQG